MRLEWFAAERLDEDELDELLETGWRCFGRIYFRPACSGCRECVPIRVHAGLLHRSKSLRRVQNRNADTMVSMTPLRYYDAAFEVYQDHSWHRFQKETSREQFRAAFYTPTCPCMQSEYRIGGTLAALGFLNRSSHALSSVYFVYHNDFSRFSLGTYSALVESDYAAKLGLTYYYLGYCIRGNRSMSYKGRFRPRQVYDWEKGEWYDMDCREGAGRGAC